MADPKDNLETLQNLRKKLVRIAKNPANIAILVVLIQTTKDKGLIVEEIVKQVRETFGNDSLGADEIRYRLNRLVGHGWAEKNYRLDIARRYEYNLSDNGSVMAKFCQDMLGILNTNRLKEE